MLVSSRLVLFAWIMAMLLIVNSLVILINIFDFPVTGMRHLISFTSALGVIIGFMFITLGISQFLSFRKRS
jgi:hypothetical protein